MRYGFGVGGGLIKNKISFNLNVFGSDAYDTPNLNAALPDGTVVSQPLNVHAQHNNLFVNGQADYALTLDQTLRFGYNFTRFTNDNFGIGGYDGPGRAYSNESNAHNIRVQHYGPIGRRMFSRSRLQLFVTDTGTQSATNAPTVRVNDAFTSGGAQLAGGDHSRRLNFGSDLEKGPAADDIRHRVNVQFNNQIVRNLIVSLNVNALSGAPYTMLTGRDDNGDGIFNDRPAGVGRNTLRGDMQANTI